MAFVATGKSALGLRLAVVAIALGTAGPSLAARPASGLSLTLPGGPSGSPRAGAHPEFHPACLSDDDVSAELEAAGWRHIAIGDPIGHFRLMAFGKWHAERRLYQMVVDRCSGQVDHVQPVRYDTPPSQLPEFGPPVHQQGRRVGFGTGD